MSRPQMERTELIDALNRGMRQTIVETVLLFERFAQSIGMNATDFQCMNMLDYMGPLTAGQLAELTGLTTGAITGVIDRLEKAGYAQRVRDPQDRRRVVVQLQHKDEFNELTAIFQFIYQETLKGLSEYSDQELATILDFVDKTHPFNQRVLARLRENSRNHAQKPDQQEP